MSDGRRQRVLQMRLVVEATDYDEAVSFYRDVLGATEELQIHGDNGEKVTILDVGRATLEISSPAQVEMIDRYEVRGEGEPPPAGRLRGPRRRWGDRRAHRGRREPDRQPDQDTVGLSQRATRRTRWAAAHDLPRACGSDSRARGPHPPVGLRAPVA